MEEHHVAANGIRLHVVQDGPTDGPLLLLLHGFPEFWYGWRHQIRPLAEAGYRVWAPDQRGYNLSDKPQGIAAYNLDALAADVIGLLDAAGREKAFVVGHDWGGSVAWWVAAKYPERVERLVVINVPHGAVMLKNLRRNRAQQRRSWYMFFFQMRWLPEAVSRLGNWQLLVRMLRSSSRSGTFSAADLALYRAAWSQRGAYTAMLKWYRALFKRPPAPAPKRPIAVPTLLIWGAQDRFLGREMAEPSIKLCADAELVFVEDATHWVHHEEAERVNELMLRFLSGATRPEPS